MQDYYKILEVSNTASQEEIKQNYRMLAKKWHPDANGNTAESEEKFKAISEAYSVLSSPEKRQEYDELSRLNNSTKYDFNNFGNNRSSRHTYDDGGWEFTYTYTNRKNSNRSSYNNHSSASRIIAKGAIQVAVGVVLFTFPGFFPLFGIYAVFSGISNIGKGLSFL